MTEQHHSETDGIERLLEIMARLRDPERGCPWDVEQSFATIAPYTIEEAYEVADAIERDDMPALRSELGDLLFQVVFHAQMAREAGAFDFDDVIAAICDKMIQRHPHVFGDAQIDSADAQSRAWERHKLAEARGGEDTSVLAGISRGLPEWLRALKLQKRAASVGFDWPDSAPVLDKVREELDELQAALDDTAGAADRSAIEEEVGDLLFCCVNLARHAGVDTGRALRLANAKFERRFRGIERRLTDQGETPEDHDLDTLDGLWDTVKADERGDANNR